MTGPGQEKEARFMLCFFTAWYLLTIAMVASCMHHDHKACPTAPLEKAP